jgi:putative transposase
MGISLAGRLREGETFTAYGGVPRVIVTDKLRSYSAAKAELLPSVEHYQQKHQNNRTENSHQPTRLRERLMRRFKSSGQAQRFLSAFGIISSHFSEGRHRYSASGYREVMNSRVDVWEEVIRSRAIMNFNRMTKGGLVLSHSSVASFVKLS